MKQCTGDERMRQFVADLKNSLPKFICLLITDEKAGEGVIWMDGEENSIPPIGYVHTYLPRVLNDQEDIISIKDNDGRDIYYNKDKHNAEFVLELASRV